MSQKLLFKILALIAAIGVGAVLFAQFGNELSLKALSQREEQLLQLKEQYPIGAYAVAFLVYVIVTALSIPGATAMTLMMAWYFGFIRALVIVSFASTLGATLAFLFSRYMFRDIIEQRFGDRLHSFDESLKREGPFYLFTLRLIPLVPFFAINLVMGLTPINVGTFWWVSQLGMLPGTTVYVFTGASFPRLSELAERGASGIITPQILLAFALLATFPLIVRTLMRKIRPSAAEEVTADAEQMRSEESTTADRK